LGPEKTIIRGLFEGNYIDKLDREIKRGNIREATLERGMLFPPCC
jgi:hypothetical protein